MQRVVLTLSIPNSMFLQYEQEGMIVLIEEGKSYGGVGKTMDIQVFGGAQTVTIEIIS